MEAPKIKTIYHFSSRNISKYYREKLASDFPDILAQYNEIKFIKDTLDYEKIDLVKGADAIICFVRDTLDDKVLQGIAERGVKLVLLRTQNHYWVDKEAAEKFKIQIAYTPYYSPYSIAEFAMALLSAVNRKIHKAYNRVREGNFELDGLLGTDLHGKTVGVMGFGKIGRCFAKICIGYGMKVLVWDKVKKNEENLKVEFVSLGDLFEQSDVISIHLALNEETRYIINEKNIKRMKQGAFLINTSRGAIINSEDLLQACLDGRFSGVGLDVYDDKKEVFYKEFHGDAIDDQTLSRLIGIPKVLVTCRQGWLTEENVVNVFKQVFKNIEAFNKTGKVEDSIY